MSVAICLSTYSLKQVRHQDFRGPDVLVVLNVPKGERKIWVCWEEGKAPDVVIELLSVSTQNADNGEKKAIYQNQMRVSEYFWYDPFNPDDWAGFQLQGTYQPIAVNTQGQLVSQVLNLGLTRWLGTYQGISTTWLRWVHLDGTLLPTTTELAQQQAEQARQQAALAQQRAEQAQQQVRQIVRNLRQTGMTADQIARVTGLSLEQVNTSEGP